MDHPVKQTVRGRRLTPEEAQKYHKIRDEIDREKPEISARIRARIAGLTDLAGVFAELKKVREAKGLSLTDMQEATGIDKASLSKLETGQRANFTLETVLRYADAVGKHVQFALSEKTA
jgi:DNA-binding XRE family transcriptional regulator